MGDFSRIQVADGFPLIPTGARGDDFGFQSKDFPDDADDSCVDGTIRADGLFETWDGRWNPALDGWVHLLGVSARGFGFGGEWLVRFEAGRAVEAGAAAVDGLAIPIDEHPGFPGAWRSVGDWRPIAGWERSPDAGARGLPSAD